VGNLVIKEIELVLAVVAAFNPVTLGVIEYVVRLEAEMEIVRCLYVMRRQHIRCTPPALEKKFPLEGVAGGLGRAFHRLAHRAAIKSVGVLLAEKR